MKRKPIPAVIAIALLLALTLLPYHGGYADGRDHTPMDAPYTQRK